MGVEKTSPIEIPLVRRLIARSSSIPSSSAFFDGVALLAASFPFRKILRGWALPALEPRPDNGVPSPPHRHTPPRRRAGERIGRTPRNVAPEGASPLSGTTLFSPPDPAGGGLKRTGH